MKILATLCFVLAGALSTARADVAFSNFGPGDTYNNFAGWTIGSAPGGDVAQGEAFIAGASGGVTGIDVAFFRTSGSDDVTLSLRSDAAGLPGTVLGTYVIDDSQIASHAQVIHLSASGDVALSAGTEYWLIADTAATSSYAWDQSLAGAGSHYCNDSTGSNCHNLVVTTTTQGVFRIEVSSVPEPTTIALLGIGLAGLGFSRRKSAN